MKAELKPCPFCGGDASFDHDDNGWNWIHCKSCDATTNARVSAMDDCKPLLAEAWNRRAPAEPVKVPSDAEIDQLAYEHCDDTDASGEQARFTSERAIIDFARALLASYGQPAQPANTPPVGALNPELTLKGLIHKIEVAANPNQGAVPWFMCSLLQQALPHLRVLDSQPAASAEPVLSALLGMQRFFGKWPEFVPAPEYIDAACDAVKRMNSVLSDALEAAPSLDSPESKENQ